MGLLGRFTNLFRRNTINSEIAAELQAHIDLATEANMQKGLPHAVAKRDALVRFGNPTSTRERVTAAETNLGLEGFLRDIRYALRQLSKTPGFTVTAILTLAVGLGANTAIFSSMDAVVLRPIDVPSLDRVVVIDEQDHSGYQSVALANFEDWQRQSRSFEDLSVRTTKYLSMTGAGDPAHVEASLVSANFFSVLRVQPVMGRLFIPAENEPGRDAVALLNYGFWQRNFAKNGDVLGRRIQLDQRDYTIIGVLPRSVQYPSTADIFLPLAPTPVQRADRAAHDYFVAGRLRDGVTVQQAQAEFRGIAQHLEAAYPATNQGWTVHIEPLLDDINGDLTPLYYKMTMGAAFLVLLVVCANVANLQFARGIARRPEIAMRAALGASKTSILRQVLTENILLGLFGAAGGLLLGGIYLHLTVISMPDRVARYMAGWSNIGLNGRAFIFSIGLALIAGIVSGIAPALGALRVNIADQLKAGSRSTTVSRRSHRLRNAFAVAQVALALTLVVGAALIAKGMFTMLHLPSVYEPKQVLTFNVTLPQARYDTPEKKAAWFAQSLQRLRSLPGVAHAEVTTSLPYSDVGDVQEVEIQNRRSVPGKAPAALRLSVSPGYFSALHIAVLSGRGFNQGDALTTQPVALVSRRFVAEHFPNQNPMGQHIRVGGKGSLDPWLTVVGVVDEASYSLWDPIPHDSIYVDAAQLPPPEATFAVFSKGDPLALAPSSRKALAAIDPALPLDAVESYQQLINESLTGLIYVAVMLALDGLVALLLAAIGVFGIMASLVGEQNREIGVRLAMGAQREDVLRMILRRATRLAGIGIALGLVLAFVLSHFVANLLRGVRPDDPLVFTSITLAIALVAIGSSWIPAWRASRVDPMCALRSE